MVKRICMCEHHERIFYSKESDIDAYDVFVMDCNKVGERGWECLVVEVVECEQAT